MLKSRIFLLAIFFIGAQVNAQEISNSTNQVISSKANKGGLYHIKKDDKVGELQLTYLLKGKKGKDITEVYHFEKSSLKFKESKEVVQDATKLKVKPIKGGNKILRVFPAMGSGQIKLQLGHIQYTTGVGVTGKSYVIPKFIKETQVKPKGTDGDRLVYMMHHTLESDANKMRFAGNNYNLNIGDAFILGVENSDPLFTKYESIVYDATTLNTKKRTKIELPYSHHFLSGKVLSNGNIAAVFASFTIKDIFNPKVNTKVMAKYKLAPKYGFWYLELNPMGEIIHSTAIDAPEPEEGWYHACTIAEGAEGEVTILGSLKGYKIKAPPTKKIVAMHIKYKAGLQSINQNKADYFYATHIKNGKQTFHKKYKWSDLIKNSVSTEQSAHLVPKDMKSYLKYDWFSPVASNSVGGKLLITFQKNETSSQIMQINATTGEIEKNYFVGPDKKLALSEAAGPRYLKNSKGELFVITYQQKAEKDPSAEKQQNALFTCTAHIQKIDVVNGKIGKPVSLCNGGTLDPYDGIWMEDKDNFITLSSGRKKEIILNRISLK